MSLATDHRVRCAGAVVIAHHAGRVGTPLVNDAYPNAFRTAPEAMAAGLAAPLGGKFLEGRTGAPGRLLNVPGRKNRP